MKEDKLLRVVLDTNVLISALGFRTITKKIWELVEENRFQLFTSAFILQELERNLIKKVELSPDQTRALIDNILGFSVLVEPNVRVSEIQNDLADNRILECALEAKADVLVTRDLKHIRILGHFQGIEILTPQEFLSKYF